MYSAIYRNSLKSEVTTRNKSLTESKQAVIGLTTLRPWPSNVDQDIRLKYSINRHLDNVNGASGQIPSTL
ncbi:hypothetical protein [Nitrosomonas cryotolerans]|uniref:hypothetical protein n=1 Tax=Nitrosomonas cryotolerans TaxID=44575 RepID=UPI0009414CD1|nr:hypothetical protein [Nitrosomonas cryotolerans]